MNAMESLLPHLFDVSLRSLPLAIVAAALLRIPRLRSAAWAHAVWTMVLLSMLVLLFVAGPVLKPIPLRVLPAQASVAPERIAILALPPLPDVETSVPSATQVISTKPPKRSFSVSEIAMFLYVFAAAVLLGRLLVGSWLARRLLRGSERAGETFYQSPRIAVPLTIGWFRPVILLPSSWRTWDKSKSDAVLLHESSHVRRHDSLIALLAGINRCLFWFHPLAWWMERKLAFLAEQACDEACVCALDNRREYARLLLEMAGAVEASGGRLSGHALAMARPSQVRQRIDAILDETRAAHRGLTAMSWAAALLCGVPLMYAAGSLRVEPRLAPPLPRISVPAPPAVQPPKLVAQADLPLVAPRPGDTVVLRAPSQSAAVIPLSAAVIPILVPVVVTEPAGRYVTGLAAENFRITENQVEQPIAIFGSAEGQHAIAVLDTSWDLQDAIQGLGKTLSPQDQVMIVGPATLANPAPPASWDSLRMALLDALMELKKMPNPVKSVIVLTRGAANNPLRPERDDREILVMALSAPRVAVSFANIEDIAETATFPPGYSQLDDMRTLAGATGGQMISAGGVEEMKTALARFGLGLRNQYLLGFAAPVGAPKGLRRLKIEIVRAYGAPPMQAIGPQAYMH
jgi:beta-lactamase regulating signal transducer with metallopeptidase domain